MNRSIHASSSTECKAHQLWMFRTAKAMLALSAWFMPIVSNTGFGQEATPTLAPGISTTRPDSGPHVALSDGTFMVPYTQKVDSTDIVFEMIPIPGGEFVMGSPDTETGRLADEGPQFTVVVEPFWMAKTELTWAEYKTFMKTYDIFKRLSRQGIRKATSLDESDAITIPTPLYEPSHTFEHGDDNQQPAVTMTQYAAKQYTKWLSGLTTVQYRLPNGNTPPAPVPPRPTRSAMIPQNSMPTQPSPTTAPRALRKSAARNPMHLDCTICTVASGSGPSTNTMPKVSAIGLERN
jgi:hypothetical protein